MSQRRTVASGKVFTGGVVGGCTNSSEMVKLSTSDPSNKDTCTTTGTTTVATVVSGSLSLEQPEITEPMTTTTSGVVVTTTGTSSSSALAVVSSSSHNTTSGTSSSSSLTLEERYEVENHNLRLKKWRESPFAVGLTEPTWLAERSRKSSLGGGGGPVGRRNGGGGSYGDEELNPDESGCLCMSAHVCTLLGAGRVGNMAVLHSSTEWIEEVYDDEETGEQIIRRYNRPRLNIVVGPYWPMLIFVTYPLIFLVSGWAFVSGILPGKKPFFIVFIWICCTLCLIIALALTACRDPGIFYRTNKAPTDNSSTSWRWSDQALTYRPRTAFYDTDTAVVVDGFDHTCPWTGTAIGKKNMMCFQTFVCMIFLCMVLDIFILTGAF